MLEEERCPKDGITVVEIRNAKTSLAVNVLILEVDPHSTVDLGSRTVDG